jgi:hypothetical protein
MQLDALHRPIVDDVRAMHATVDSVFPSMLPKQWAAHAINFAPFIKRLNAVTEPMKVYNEIEHDATVEAGMVRCSGLWVSKGDLPENSSSADIRIIWYTADKRLQLTQPEWNRRRFFFWQMYMHELVHRHQDVHRTGNIRVYRPRGTTERDVKKEQEYYGNYDEIEAHSHDGALELVAWWGHLSFRQAVQEALSYHGRMLTPTVLLYDATFGDTPDHPALKQFKKKLRVWYDVMKSSDVYELIQLPNLVVS